MNRKLVWVAVLTLLLMLILAGCSSPEESAPTAQAAAAVQTAAPTVGLQTTIQPALESSDVLDALQDKLGQVYDLVNPSVVNVQVAASGEGISGLFPGIPQMQQGLGSGFVWDQQGHIVTNNHVVEGADEVTVTFYDGTTVAATVVGQDADSDLAVIKVDVDAEMLRPVQVADSTQARVGQLVVAIGNPYGYEGTQTVGFISAVGRSLPASTDSQTGSSYTIPDVIQTDAPINPGNSGGVLVDGEGRLLGVTTAIESSIGQNAGIGFAVPSAIVQKVVPALIEEGSFKHPWIGISGTSMTADLAETMRLDREQRGALVISVTAGSPAEKAGLQGSDENVSIDGQQMQVGGDIIVAIGGQPVKEFDDLVAYLARSTAVGDTVSLSVLRDGKQQEISLTLGSRPTSGQSTSRTQSGQGRGNGAYLGIEGVTMTSDIAGAMNLSSDQEGVLVQNVVSGSPADEAGVRGSYRSATVGGQQVKVGGDVIVALDRKAVTSMRDLQDSLAEENPGQTATLTVLRDGNRITLDVTLGSPPANP